MDKQTRTPIPEKRDKLDIIDALFTEIEKDIEGELSFSTNRKDELGSTLRRIFIKEKAYRDPELSRDALIKRLGIGKELFIETFQYCFGMPFRECVNLLRLKESVILLEQSDLHIKEIAGKVGFGTTRTFQRQFMEKYGTTPNDYRRINLQASF